MNLNKVLIIGNLTRDVELRATPTGTPVATLGVATNRIWKDQSGQQQRETEFHNVVVWGKQAELCNKYLAKGRLVMIEGRLQTRSWDDKQTGQKRSRTEIIAERIQFGPRLQGLGGPGESGEQDFGQKQPPAGEQSFAPEPLAEINLDDEPADTMPLDIGEAPF